MGNRALRQTITFQPRYPRDPAAPAGGLPSPRAPLFAEPAAQYPPRPRPRRVTPATELPGPRREASGSGCLGFDSRSTTPVKGIEKVSGSENGFFDQCARYRFLPPYLPVTLYLPGSWRRKPVTYAAADFRGCSRETHRFFPDPADEILSPGSTRSKPILDRVDRPRDCRADLASRHWRTLPILEFARGFERGLDGCKRQQQGQGSVRQGYRTVGGVPFRRPIILGVDEKRYPAHFHRHEQTASSPLPRSRDFVAIHISRGIWGPSTFPGSRK